MKTGIYALIALSAVASGAFAQTPPASQSLAATLEVYVFPNAGQAASQQSKDESECFNWAVNNTGVDPFQIAQDAERQKQQAEERERSAQAATSGAGARGAVRGAAAGALIGEIANDDASKGAATGAAIGAVRGRRQARAYRAQAEQQSQESVAAVEADTAQKVTNFKKAFSVCLESKDYLVRY